MKKYKLNKVKNVNFNNYLYIDNNIASVFASLLLIKNSKENFMVYIFKKTEKQ